MRIKPSVIPAAAIVAVALLTACQQQAPAVPEAPAAAPEASVEPAPAPASTTPAVLELAATDEQVKTQVGQRDAEGLASTGKGGVLAFGPYKPLTPGQYVLTVRGSSTKPFTVDVVSQAGKVVHVRKALPAAEGEGVLATLPFDLAEAAAHVEVRVLVPENSDTRLSGYRIDQR